MQTDEQQLTQYIQNKIIKRVNDQTDKEVELSLSGVIETQPIGLMKRIENEGVLIGFSPNPIYKAK